MLSGVDFCNHSAEHVRCWAQCPRLSLSSDTRSGVVTSASNEAALQLVKRQLPATAALPRSGPGVTLTRLACLACRHRLRAVCCCSQIWRSDGAGGGGGRCLTCSPVMLLADWQMNTGTARQHWSRCRSRSRCAHAGASTSARASLHLPPCTSVHSRLPRMQPGLTPLLLPASELHLASRQRRGAAADAYTGLGSVLLLPVSVV